MSNVIKYSSGATPSGCLRRGNMLIGNGTSDYGNTFYSGITPSAGGYTIYQNKVSGGPSIYTPSSDSDLITMTNTQVAGSVGSPASYTTAAQCLNYYTSQSDKICVNMDYEGIVTSGLIINVDAGFTPSYPKGGTGWYDSSGNSNNATLINSPTYSSGSGGSIAFDDVSLQYATISNVGNLSVWTVEVWFNLTTSLAGKVTSIMSNVFNGSVLNFSVGTNNAPANTNLAVGFYNGAWRSTAGFVPSINTWYQVVGTYDGTTIRQYVNGSANGGNLTYSGTPTSGGGIRLMARWDDISTSPNYADGNLAIARLYNRSLSAAEITQNYNAQKGRFGL